ncbi:MAG TPA: S41 family peptidase [Pseudonocardiaceae bacterium]|nr:S41 family peptidase [Pseudonocardiaceae bacterium]
MANRLAVVNRTAAISATVLELPPGPADAPDVPVAVLHDRRTASAGEGLVVAFRGRARTRTFGSATAGVPTGTVTHELLDGSALVITVSVAVDRQGREYAEAIAPDEPRTGIDPIRTAVRWLSSCR